MINRRVLRVKTMQSIYAYRVLKQSIYELAKDEIKGIFEPDYMAKVPENRQELKKEESLTLAAFDEWHKDNSFNYRDKPEKISNALSTSVDFYKKSLKKDVARLNKKLVLEIEEIFNSYLQILAIIFEVKNLSDSTSESNLINNSVISCLEKNVALSREINNRGISWNGHTSVLRKFLKQSILKNEEYLVYRDVKNPSFEEDQSIILYIFRKMIFEDEIIQNHFEEVDLYWSENKNILKGMIKKTLKDITEVCDENMELLDISNNWEDDKAYIVKLFESTLEIELQSVELISAKSKNWEIDRLALTDKIILNMGLAEMMSFANIPVKVTINEYIEVSKIYSTPQSRTFINGILDSISQDLIANGTIKKSGRGLIDNK